MLAQRRPKLGVIYDTGSAKPVDIVMACRRLCKPVFLVSRPASQEDPAGEGPLAGGFHDISDCDAPTAARKLLDLGVEHIITFSDHQLLRTAEIAAHAGLRFLSVRTAEACRDKLLQRRLLAEAGVDAVASALVSTPAELPGALADMTLPVVVKPRRGAGSVDTVRIDTMEEAERWATRQAERIRTEPGAVREFVAEEMLMGDTGCAGADFGDYVSVESVIEGASVRHVSVNGKFPLTEPFRECGQVLPSTVPPEVQQRCRDLAEGAIRALGIDIGITHTEMKLTPTGPRIIEVNGRLGGYCAELIGRSTGFSMVGAAVRMALGLPVGDLPDLPEHITYQFFFQPPQNAVRLVTRAEPDAVAGISHVSRFEPYLQPGAELDWHRGTPAMSGVLFGEAPDHHAVLAAVEAAGEALKITYE